MIVNQYSLRESKHVNPYTNTIKTHSVLSVITSWRLLNQENARACDMENFCAMPMYLDPSMMTPYHKCDQRRLRRACAFVQSCQGHAAH